MPQFSPLFLGLIALLGLSACRKTDSQAPSTWYEGREVSTASGQRYETGFRQTTSINQDPWVRKYDASGNLLWEHFYETSAVDGRGLLMALDEAERPWVVFSVDGGVSGSEGISRLYVAEGAFDQAIFRGFGRAQGAAKVAVLARLDPETGQIVKGSFFMSRTTEGNIDAVNKTNSMEVGRLGFSRQGLHLQTRSWFKPPMAGSTHSNFLHLPEATEEAKQGLSYWQVAYVLDMDLSTIKSAEINAE